MRIFLFLLCFGIQKNVCLSQQIVNAVLVGDKGITNKTEEAKYLIVVKKYNDTLYERLDYNFAGPIIKRASYRDSLLTILNGPYSDFAGTGYINDEGRYKNNKKEGNWFLYNDTAHATLNHIYHADSLVAVIDLDSLARERKKIITDTTDQREAAYKGGEKNFSKFIRKSFKVPERTTSISMGGTARARFVIDTLGNIIDVKLIKSVEFAFDEEFLRVIPLGKGWTPASDKGKKLKSYREIPISIKFDE